VTRTIIGKLSAQNCSWQQVTTSFFTFSCRRQSFWPISPAQRWLSSSCPAVRVPCHTCACATPANWPADTLSSNKPGSCYHRTWQKASWRPTRCDSMAFRRCDTPGRVAARAQINAKNRSEKTYHSGIGVAVQTHARLRGGRTVRRTWRHGLP
jgi:hypothetical protein